MPAAKTQIQTLRSEDKRTREGRYLDLAEDLLKQVGWPVPDLAARRRESLLEHVTRLLKQEFDAHTDFSVDYSEEETEFTIRWHVWYIDNYRDTDEEEFRILSQAVITFPVQATVAETLREALRLKDLAERRVYRMHNALKT